MNKTMSLLTNLGVTLLASSLLTNSVQASTVLESREKIGFDSSEMLISQDLGHDEYDGLPQMEWENYQLGTVVGQIGNILFVRLPDGSHFQDSESFRFDISPGDNVLVEEIDDRYYIVEGAHSRWISYLEAEYGWRNVRRIEPPLLERTAPIWAQLESNTTTSTIPPRTTPTPSYTPVEQPTMNEPVRGLY